MRFMSTLIVIFTVTTLSGCNSKEVKSLSSVENVELSKHESQLSEVELKDDITNIAIPESMRIRVFENNLYLREDTSTDSNIVTSLNKRETYNVIDAKYDKYDNVWYELKSSDNEEGWLNSEHCFFVELSDLLGEYVSSYNIDVMNKVMNVFDFSNIEMNGNVILAEDIDKYRNQNKYDLCTHATDLEYDEVSYVYSHEIDSLDNEFAKVHNPVFINSDTLLYLIHDENEKVYLVKRYIEDKSVEIVYSMELEGEENRSSYYLSEIVSMNENYVIYKIRNDLLIYNIKDELVQSHYRYKNTQIIDISDDMKYVAVEDKHGSYITDYELKKANEIYLGNGKFGESALYPTVSFANGKSNTLNINLVGYEWSAGDYYYDKNNDLMLDIRFPEDDFWTHDWDWEEALEYPNNMYLIMPVYYGGEPEYIPIRAIFSDFSKLHTFDEEYFFYGTINSLHTEYGIPLYDINRNLVYYSSDSNKITKVTGIEEGAKVVASSEDGSITLCINDGQYVIYRKRE